MDITTIVDLATTIAVKLPTGRVDPRALQKLRAEEWEWLTALAVGDTLGAATELADVAYYVGKAVDNQLMHADEALRYLMDLCDQASMTLEQAYTCLQAKYEVRVGNQAKHDDAERTNVARALASSFAWDWIPPARFTSYTDVRATWSDFRDTTYISGQIQIAYSVRLTVEHRQVFNGWETTTTYPAFRDGQAVVWKETRFHPDNGHADYGHSTFITINDLPAVSPD